MEGAQSEDNGAPEDKTGDDAFTDGRKEEKPLFPQPTQPSSESRDVFPDDFEGAFAQNEQRLSRVDTPQTASDCPPEHGEYRRPEFLSYSRPETAYNTDEYTVRPETPFKREETPVGSVRIDAGSETPMIFRTRMDENMLIYEYSDRLEFYKKTPEGLVRLSTEYKYGSGGRRMP